MFECVAQVRWDSFCNCKQSYLSKSKDIVLNYNFGKNVLGYIPSLAAVTFDEHTEYFDMWRVKRSQSNSSDWSMSAQRRADWGSALWRIILLSSYCLHSLCQRCVPVNIRLSASLLQYETPVSLRNLCLSSPVPPSPPECNKCPAIIYFNSLPSCTDEMDS